MSDYTMMSWYRPKPGRLWGVARFLRLPWRWTMEEHVSVHHKTGRKVPSGESISVTGVSDNSVEVRRHTTEDPLMVDEYTIVFVGRRRDWEARA